MAVEFSRRLDAVSCSGILTDRFEQALDEVREHLPALFSGDFPMALSQRIEHPGRRQALESGLITGVVNWTDVGIQPFGLALYVLEKIIGSMGRDGWLYLDNASLLRDEFWKAFVHHAGPITHSQKENIEASRKAGYRFRYGTYYSSGQKGVAGIENVGIEKRRLYLEAIL